jgi:hypothetical protein
VRAKRTGKAWSMRPRTSCRGCDYTYPVSQERFVDRHHDTLDSLIPMPRKHGKAYELVSTEVDIVCQVNLSTFEDMTHSMIPAERRALYKEIGQ